MIKIDSLIGQPFFYVDEEAGIGWESIIDEVSKSHDSGSVYLYLSCGTKVKISGKDYYTSNYKAFRTNLKE